MKRDFLKSLGIDKDIIDQIMKEHGETVQTIQKTADDAKAELEKVQKLSLSSKESCEKEIEILKAQQAELQKTINEAPNLDEALKKATEDMQKGHEDALKALKKESEDALKSAQREAETQVANLKRDSETVDFLNSLEKKFVTPETKEVFRQKLNEAIVDKNNEGKNRAELFKSLIVDAEGKERIDIFAVQQQSGAAGSHGNPPIQESVPDTIRGALQSKYGG